MGRITKTPCCTTLEGNTYAPVKCISSSTIIYDGSNLPNIGIETYNNLTLALEKIDNELSPYLLAQNIINVISNNVQLKTIFCNLVNSCL